MRIGRVVLLHSCNAIDEPAGTGAEQRESEHQRADPVSEHRRVPAAFTELVGRCLDPDPEQRPSVAEVTARLDALLA